MCFQKSERFQEMKNAGFKALAAMLVTGIFFFQPGVGAVRGGEKGDTLKTQAESVKEKVKKEAKSIKDRVKQDAKTVKEKVKADAKEVKRDAKQAGQEAKQSAKELRGQASADLQKTGKALKEEGKGFKKSLRDTWERVKKFFKG